MLASLSSIHLEPWFAPSWESPNDSNKLKIALAAWECGLCQQRKDALTPAAVQGDHTAATDLSAPEIEMIHRLATDSGRLSRKWQRSIIDGGLSESEYVEITGIVAMVSILDAFCRGAGLPPSPRPEPVASTPPNYAPPGAKEWDAWVPLVAPDDVVATDGELYRGRASGIHRALTSVPETKRAYWQLAEAHYLPGREMPNLDTEARAISRSQIELLAARVSSLHACFY